MPGPGRGGCGSLEGEVGECIHEADAWRNDGCSVEPWNRKNHGTVHVLGVFAEGVRQEGTTSLGRLAFP